MSLRRLARVVTAYVNSLPLCGGWFWRTGRWTMSMDRTPELAQASPPAYAADVTLSLQRVLAALADVEVGYDRDLEQLRQEALSESRRLQVAQELERRRRRYREPLLRCLDELPPC